MGRREVRFSDLSGKLILDDAEVVKLRVIEHPALTGRPVQLEAMPADLKGIEKATLTVAVIELELPGQPPARLVLDVGAFDRISTEQPMAELLEGHGKLSTPSRSTAENHTRRGSKKDYTDVRYAGQVKRGIVSDGEKRTVREFFDEVNSNLRAAGQREIDLSNAEHVDKYGLHELARERNLVPIVDLESNVEDSP